jgi:hypothetical protein
MSSTPEIYAPGTELMHYFRDGVSNRPATCVTVITGGNVFVTAGLGAGTIMKYADWFILAGGKPLRVFTPIPGLPTLIEKSPSVPIGTRFEWVQGPETYRVAYQTANGVLQVKSVTDGGGECDMAQIVDGTYPLIRTMFADEESWLASLPEGGSVTATKGYTNAHNPHADDTAPTVKLENECGCRSDGLLCDTHLYE